MTFLTSEVCNKSDNLNSEYIWKALKQKKKQAAVKNKQQVNTVTVKRNNKEDNNKSVNSKISDSDSDIKPNICKSCEIPHKTDSEIVCHDKKKTCEKCDTTEH